MSEQTLPSSVVQPQFSPSQVAETLGFKVGQNFSERASQELAERPLDDRAVGLATEQLAGLGLNIDPKVIPLDGQGIRAVELFTDQDKAAIRDSDEPIIALWSTVNLRSAESRRPHSVGREKDRLSRSHQEQEIAVLAAMGMVHGTKLSSLTQALDQGVFLPNREIKDSYEGNTNLTDRDMGLDAYVFADFARPNALRRHTPPEVEVVFDLEAFMAPGSFATTDDIADCEDIEGYMRGVVQPSQFLEAAQVKLDSTIAAVPNADTTFGRKLRAKEFIAGVDGDPTQHGKNLFSTWEMKMPSVQAAHVKKIVFRDPGKFQEFKQRYGDAFKAELVAPDEEPVYYDPDELSHSQKELAEVHAAEHHLYLTEQLAALPDEQKEVVSVAMRPVTRETDYTGMEKTLSSGELPSISASTPEELGSKIQASPYGYIQGMEDFPYPLTDKAGQYMVASVERSKADPNLARFLDSPKTISTKIS
jgi:hypothetical protein